MASDRDPLFGPGGVDHLFGGGSRQEVKKPYESALRVQKPAAVRANAERANQVIRLIGQGRHREAMEVVDQERLRANEAHNAKLDAMKPAERAEYNRALERQRERVEAARGTRDLSIPHVDLAGVVPADERPPAKVAFRGREMSREEAERMGWREGDQ